MDRSSDFPPRAWELALGSVFGAGATYVAGAHEAGPVIAGAVIVPIGWYCRALGRHAVATRRARRRSR